MGMMAERLGLGGADVGLPFSRSLSFRPLPMLATDTETALGTEH